MQYDDVTEQSGTGVLEDDVTEPSGTNTESVLFLETNQSERGRTLDRGGDTVGGLKCSLAEAGLKLAADQHFYFGFTISSNQRRPEGTYSAAYSSWY